LIAQKVFGKSLLHVRLKTMINWIQNKRKMTYYYILTLLYINIRTQYNTTEA